MRDWSPLTLLKSRVLNRRHGHSAEAKLFLLDTIDVVVIENIVLIEKRSGLLRGIDETTNAEIPNLLLSQRAGGAPTDSEVDGVLIISGDFNVQRKCPR